MEAKEKIIIQTVLFKLNKAIISMLMDVAVTPTATTDKFIHTSRVVIISSGYFSQKTMYLYNLLYLSFALLIWEFVRLVTAVSAPEKNAVSDKKKIKIVVFIIKIIIFLF